MKKSNIEKDIKKWGEEENIFINEIFHKECKFAVSILYPPKDKDALPTLIYQDKHKIYYNKITFYARLYFPKENIKTNIKQFQKLIEDFNLTTLFLNSKFLLKINKTNKKLSSICLYQDVYIDTLIVKGHLLKALDNFNNCKIFFINKFHQTFKITPEVDIEIY